MSRCVQGRQGRTLPGWRLGALRLPGLGGGTGHLPRSQLLGGGLAPWEAGRGGAATFPRRGLSGPQSVPSLRGPPLCAKGQQVWFPLGWGVGPPLGQQPGPSAAPYPSLGFQHLLLPHGDSRPGWRWEPLCPPPEDRAPAGGACGGGGRALKERGSPDACLATPHLLHRLPLPDDRSGPRPGWGGVPGGRSRSQLAQCRAG